MVGVLERSSSEEPEPTGWALVRTTVRAFGHEMRDPTPLPVRYLRCDGHGQATPHTRIRGWAASAQTE